jgi:hypothetical protein
LYLWAKISAGPGMVHSDVIEKIKLVAAKNGIYKNERMGNSHLRLRSLLLFAMEERALATVARNCVCEPRYQLACGWFFSM